MWSWSGYMEPQSKSEIRLKFFDLLFSEQEGWLCIATTDKDIPKSSFRQRYFDWPHDHVDMENFIIQSENRSNIYFCSSLLKKPERVKANCLESDIIWADLDEVDPNSINDFPPGIVVQTSPNRWQAFWKLATRIPPELAEHYSKRLAYHLGADRSGWDLTQLFRVPLTKNFKYPNEPEILLERALTTRAAPAILEEIKPPPPELTDISIYRPMPEIDTLPETAAIIYTYQTEIKGTPFNTLYTQEPETDWSKVLWRFLHICFEAGMNDKEVFSIAINAACNKYARDGRPNEHLWIDVQKVQDSHQKFNINVGVDQLKMPELVREPASETFIDLYRGWAAEATDAVVEFHNLGAMILLSAITSSSVRLPTTYGTIVPNIWGLLLGDSTLTRKTTSMRMVTDILLAIDPEIVIATDGSPEGLLTGLATRPNKVSLFYKDEVSGFFDSMNRREYLSGMPETLTFLYDVPQVFTRRLRKETIVIESPAFIFFGGGVKDRVYQTVTEEYIFSGFIPRFLVVTGDADISKLRRTGPPQELGQAKRAAVMSNLADIHEQYASPIMTKIGGQKVMMPPKITARLTTEAWDRYGDIEELLIKSAVESPVADLAKPTFNRLSVSMLKIAQVLAASRQTPDKDNHITIEVDDINNAAWYGQRWGQDAIDLITKSGQRIMERVTSRVMAQVVKVPGILKSDIMKSQRLKRKEADYVLEALEDWGMIRKEAAGRGHRYWPTA